jgi:hypothetical protein
MNEQALYLIQDAEVIQVFEQEVWIKVDREIFEELVSVTDEDRSVGPNR